MTFRLTKCVGALTVGVLLATALAACGGDDDSDNATATLSLATSASTAQTTATAGSATAATTATGAAATTPTTAAGGATTTTAGPTATQNGTGAVTATSEGGSTATTSSEPTATTDPAIDAALTQAALALSDMPEGWTEEPSDDSSSDSDNGICGKPDFERKDNKLGEKNLTFSGGDFGPIVIQNLVVFPEADAADAMAYAKDSVSCTEWTETDEEGIETTYTVEPLDLPTFGDESVAVRISYDDPNLGTVITDTVYMRVGTLLSAVAYISLNAPDLDQFQTILETAAQKMQSADVPS
jgi:hypothetical protein